MTECAVTAADVDKAARYSEADGAIVLPLVYYDRLVGTLAIGTGNRDDDERLLADEEEMTFVMTLAHMLAGLLHHMRQQELMKHTWVGSERKRIAREMHDGLLQSLFFVHSELAVCRALLQKADGDMALHARIVGKIDHLREMSAASARETREYIYNLRQMGEASSEDLRESLERLTDSFARHHGMRIVRSLNVSVDRIDAALADTLLRLCREALHNVAKHAQATETIIHLNVSDTGVRLSIEDDGIGMKTLTAEGHDALDARSFGLRGMRERVQLLNGTIHIDSARGMGTKLQFTIPHARSM